MEGAADGRKKAMEAAFEDNDAPEICGSTQYPSQKRKEVEILANYEPNALCIRVVETAGESEGKDQKGIFPASVDLTTDLHSWDSSSGRRPYYV